MARFGDATDALSPPRERRLIARLRTPRAVQRYLNACRTTRSRTAARRCAASAASSATAARTASKRRSSRRSSSKQHGYPPLVLSFESIDELDHVIFVYRQRGRWGSVARSRDPGPARPQAGVRDAARARAQLRRSVHRLHRPRHRLRRRRLASVMGDYDWRLADTNVWKVERMLLDYPHRPIASSDARVERLRARYGVSRAIPDEAGVLRAASGGRRCRRFR